MTEESLFLAALDRSDPDDRRRFLDDACAGHPELRKRLDVLLAAFAAGQNKLEPPTVLTADYQPGPEPGHVVAGRYTLVEKIGAGGMGEVWVAKQTEPVHRKVALKLIKPGMDSKSVLTRFEAERQALALMDHPNIAKVLDGGLTADGRPFFVMELVNGQPLTRFCDDHHLTTRQRLELFVPVCQAVQHAHQKGIVHRDLKPSNILVTLYDGKPVPKVIDFGVAKATGGRLTDESVSTQFGAVVGTFEYMAPEQAGFSALDVDTRADIYSLGVILYELLTGLRPFDGRRLRRAAIDEVFRILREEEPPKPSTKLSTDASLPAAAAVRGTDPKKLTALMKGELDWIVMKCLEKDRSRRYETANGLVRDVQRYLADEPVEARPPGAGYRVRKFVRRNRTAVTAAAAVLVALLAGLLGTAWGLVRADDARRMAVAAREAEAAQRAAAEADRDRALKAEAEATRKNREAVEQAAASRAVSEFLRNDLLGQADIGNQAFGPDLPGRDPNVTVRELLDRAEKKIAGKFAGQPLTEAYIRHTIADTYRALGESARALPHAERAAALFAEQRGPDHLDTLTCQGRLGWLYRLQGRLDLAVPLFERCAAVMIARRGPDHLQTLKARHNLAWIYHAQGKAAEAEAIYREILPAMIARVGADDPDTLRCQTNLADLHKEWGRYDRAEPLYRDVLAARTARQGADHPETWEAKANLARLLKSRADYARAETLFAEVLATVTGVHGPDHPVTLVYRTELGFLYMWSGQHAKAEPILTAVVPVSVARLGTNAPVTLGRKNDLANLYMAQRKYEPAERLLREVLAAADTVNRDHGEILRAKILLAAVYRGRREHEKAEPLYREVYERHLARQGPDHPRTLSAQTSLAAAYWSLGQLDRSIPLFERALAARERAPGPDHPETLTTAGNLGSNYLSAGRTSEAVAMLERAHRGADRHASLKWVGPSLAEAYRQAGRPDELTVLTAELVRRDRTEVEPGSSALAARLAAHAQRLLYVRACAAAEPLIRECLAIREKHGPNGWLTFNTQSMLGEALAGQERFTEAEPLLTAAYDGLKRTAGTIPATVRLTRLVEAAERLVRLYDAWGKPAEAAKWRKELPPTEKGPAPRAVQ